MRVIRGAGWHAVPVVPGALVVYFSFSDGGFFPGSQAFACVIILVALAARVTFAERPFEGFGALVAVVAGALALYALLTLLSGFWSDAPGRALLEFNRVLLYLSALCLFGTMARDSSRVTLMVRWLALGFAAVAGVALLTRLLPETFPTAPNLQNNRVSYPLTYWNALGLLASLGVILCLHLTSRAQGSAVVRVLAAAAVPMIATTVFFTFSRGAIVAGAIGAVLYLVLARPRGLASGLIASVPLTVVAVSTAYSADALATTDPTTREAISQGAHVARVVAACMVGAAAIRFALVVLDRRVARIEVSEHVRRRVLRPLAGAAAAAAVVVAVAAGVPGFAERQYDRFARGDQTEFRGDFRQRLADPASPARQRQWRVAVRQFQSAVLKGHGAGTYQLAWDQRRPDPSTVVDAHSLYVEVLSELGLAGFALLVTAIVAVLGGFAARARGRVRPLNAALFAAGLTWTLHAGVDWDWEMPAVTVWLFALGGASLARSRRQRRPDGLGTPPYARLSIGLAILALTALPTLVAIFERHLSRSTSAFAREDCSVASREASAAISTLSGRPEPYEILGYCQIRGGRAREAIAEMRKAVDRDPHNWNYHYSLAVAQAASGIDPRRETRKAVELNPLEPLTRDLLRRFDTSSPRTWKRRAHDVAGSFRSL